MTLKIIFKCFIANISAMHFSLVYIYRNPNAFFNYRTCYKSTRKVYNFVIFLVKISWFQSFDKMSSQTCLLYVVHLSATYVAKVNGQLCKNEVIPDILYTTLKACSYLFLGFEESLISSYHCYLISRARAHTTHAHTE